MAFKLRSGNSPIFKSIGEEKETPEQYNARVRAEHEAKMQAYNDSTASYQNQVEIDNIMTNLESETDKHDDLIRSRGEVENPDGVTQEEADKLVKENNERITWGEGEIDKADILQKENEARGIYEPEKLQYRKDRNPDDLRPTKPIEPMEMIDRANIKNIDMGEPTIPDVIEPSKRKYTTSADGKWKTNLETGEKTRVKTQKVKKFGRPGKRNVRNLVTGGTNRVQ